MRALHGQDWKDREGFSLTYLPFVAHAVCRAIVDFPHVNASIEGEALVVHSGIDLAIAVDTGAGDLVAPVVRDAHLLGLAGLARAVHDRAKSARNNDMGPDGLTGGTYTISNSGSFGTYITAPIINQPQVAILSTDGVSRKPVVIDENGEERIAIRPVGVIAQSFDHRAIDGAYSASFLSRVREILEKDDWRSRF